jgi:hypothetical protein
MGDQSRAVCSTKSPAQSTIHSQISSKSQMGPYRIAGLSTGIDINGNKTSKHTNAQMVDVVVKEQFELFFLANNKINLRVIKMKEIQKSGIYDKVLLKVYEAGPRKTMQGREETGSTGTPCVHKSRPSIASEQQRCQVIPAP